MNNPYIYYKEQCDYCVNKDKCSYEKRTRKFVETIGGLESLAIGVYGALSFRCDYFVLDQLAYDRANTLEHSG